MSNLEMLIRVMLTQCTTNAEYAALELADAGFRLRPVPLALGWVVPR